MATLTTLHAASPLDADDANRLEFTNDTDQTLTKALDNVDADFVSMLNSPSRLKYTVNLRITGSPADDEYTLSIRIMSGATVMAANDAGGAWTVVTQQQNFYEAHDTDTDYGPTAFAYVNDTANKILWDAATVELKQEFFQVQTPDDGAHYAVDLVTFDGFYTGVTPDPPPVGVPNMSTIRTRPRPVADQIRRPALRMGHRYRSDLLDGLRVHWDMYELSGARVDSVAGLSLSDVGTVLGTTGLHPNKHATVHDEALTEYLEVGDKTPVRFGDEDMTLAVWFKLEAAAYTSAPLAADQNIVTKGMVGGVNSEYAIWLNGGAPGTLKFEIRGASTTTFASIGTGDINPGVWALAVGRHDSVNNTVAIYYREVGAAAFTDSQAHTVGIGVTSQSLRIGADGDAGNLFAGNIDSVSIWEKVLSDDEIDQLYRKQLFTATEQLPFPF